MKNCILITNITCLSALVNSSDSELSKTIEANDREKVRLAFDQHISIIEGEYAYVGASLSEAIAVFFAKNEPNNTELGIVEKDVLMDRYVYTLTDLKKLNNVRIYEAKNKLLIPAFANAHTHLAMNILKNSADDLALHKWLFDCIFPKEMRMRERDIKSGLELAFIELSRSGTAAAADMYDFPEVNFAIAKKSGLRLNMCIPYYHKNEGEYYLPFDKIELMHSKYRDELGLISNSCLLHSVYLYPRDSYAEVAKFVHENNFAVHMHLSETIKENEDCLAQYGKTPTEFLYDQGFFKTNTLAAHSVHLTEQDQKILSDKPVYLVHNPASNMKLASGAMPLQKYLDRGLKLALGTDGAASNNMLNMYSDMRLAALLGKLTEMEASAAKASDIFLMATLWGYRALGIKKAGYIAEGAKADCQILDLAKSEGFNPQNNLLSALIYSGDKNMLESLIVNGEFVLDNREVQNFDEEKVNFEARSSAEFLR